VAISGAIAATALALYARAGSAWFFEDDLQWLAGTLTFRPASLIDISSQVHFYRPIVALYFWMATPLFSGSPTLFHWANNVLHAANGVLVFIVATRLGYRCRFAAAAAVFFVTMPAYVEAVAWVSALAEPVATFFSLISLYGLVRGRREGGWGWMLLSLAGFVLALMAHESAAVLLPVLIIADWAFVRTAGENARAAWLRRLRHLAPYAAILATYLALDAFINARSYLVEEGHYRLGVHAVRNLLAYVISLYVGKQNLTSFIAVGLALVLLLVGGTPRVRFATAWLILWILPFAFFTWGNASRYAYTPAIGLALLLAEGLCWLRDRLDGRVAPRALRLVITVVALFITVRFASFTLKAVDNFSVRTEPYRQLAASVQATSKSVVPFETVTVDSAAVEHMQFRYVEALVRWALQEPSLTIVIAPGPSKAPQ
jgi:hypothetical protein